MNFCSSEVNKTESVYAQCVQPEDYSALESLSSSSILVAKGEEKGGKACVNRRCRKRYIIASFAPRIDRDIPPQRQERECHSRAWRTQNPLPLPLPLLLVPLLHVTRRVQSSSCSGGATNRPPPPPPPPPRRARDAISSRSQFIVLFTIALC